MVWSTAYTPIRDAVVVPCSNSKIINGLVKNQVVGYNPHSRGRLVFHDLEPTTIFTQVIRGRDVVEILHFF